jgi:hypothetical protein
LWVNNKLVAHNKKTAYIRTIGTPFGMTILLLFGGN